MGKGSATKKMAPAECESRRSLCCWRQRLAWDQGVSPRASRS